MSRMEHVIEREARCHVCEEKGTVHVRDLDFGGRYVCDDCLPHVVIAEKALHRAKLTPPNDELIEKHL